MKRRMTLVSIVAGCWWSVVGFGQTAVVQGQQVLSPGRAMYIGVDYYPEHWPRDRWETDIKLMKEAGFNTVRLAEFAWIDMEPREGQFEFGWLDDAVKLLARYDMNVILGTPTAVMPAWVAQKYPEALRMKADGTRIVWGGRKHNCYSNRDYRLLSERITLAMAQHFARKPNIIGWQIDNEFGGEECFCPSCLAQFQNWLQRRYSSLDELNLRLGQSLLGTQVHRLGRDHDPRLRHGSPVGHGQSERVPRLETVHHVAAGPLPGGPGEDHPRALPRRLHHAQLHGPVQLARLLRNGSATLTSYRGTITRSGRTSRTSRTTHRWPPMSCEG